MTITVHDAQTGEDLNAREVSREVARRNDPACHLCGCHGWTPDRPLPAEVSEPQCLHVIADRSGRNEKAYPRDNWQDVSHATAVAFGRRWADLHDMAAEFRAWVDSLPGTVEPPQPEWAEWDEAEQQAKFDHWQQQAEPEPAPEVSPQLTAKWKPATEEPEPEATTIEVDFNNVARGGQVKASTQRANGPIFEGQAVRAVEPHERDMAFRAIVASIEGRAVYLDVNWSITLPPAPEPEPTGPPEPSQPPGPPEPPVQPGPPEPRQLLREETRQLWADIREMWSYYVRSLWPRRKGDK